MTSSYLKSTIRQNRMEVLNMKMIGISRAQVPWLASVSRTKTGVLFRHGVFDRNIILNPVLMRIFARQVLFVGVLFVGAAGILLGTVTSAPAAAARKVIKLTLVTSQPKTQFDNRVIPILLRGVGFRYALLASILPAIFSCHNMWLR